MDKKLLDKLTLEEKCYFLSGANKWETIALDKINLRSFYMSDGPYGIRKETEDGYLDQATSVLSTAFPTSVVLGSTWNKDLAYKYGDVLAKEAKHFNVDMILGPGISLKRSPLCGRNFEYFSEDPYLSGIIGTNYIKGVQSNNIGCSLKHFACNNQETYRSLIDEVVDERALREIYLKGFEIAVKNSEPTSIMTSYNRLNGVFTSNNKSLLTDIARKEWGFKGFFVSDWGGCASRLEALKAGEELEMPNSGKKAPEMLIDAVKNGEISIDLINERVEKLYDSIMPIISKREPNFKCNFDDSHKISKAVSDEGMVLLKNEDNILPLKKEDKVLFVGDFFEKDKFEGSGSSKVNARKIVGLKKALGSLYNVEYVKGYDLEKKADNAIEYECLDKVKDAQKIIYLMGLKEFDESENYDRTTLSLPENQITLLKKIIKLNKNIIVILFNGSPVEMPFINDVKAILEAYLAGEAYGESIVDILYGKINPSGRLAETFPISLKDTPCYKYFPGGTNASYYKESIFVGYRYYSSFNKKTLFPFGYGLSYANFEYRSLNINIKKDAIAVSCKVKNVSDISGKEVVEIYVGGPRTTVFKPLKELKDFSKIELKPGEEKQVYIEIPIENLKYFNINEKRWVLEKGIYKFYVGGDSENAKLEKEIYINSKDLVPSPYYKSTLSSYYNGRINKVKNSEFSILLGKKLPKLNAPLFKATENSCFKTCRHSLIGRIVYKKISSIESIKNDRSTLEYALTTPFREIFLFAGDKISKEEQAIVLKVMNGKISRKNIKKFMEILQKITN